MAGRTCYARRKRVNMRNNGKSSQGISPKRSAHLKTCTPNRSQSIGGLSGVSSGGVARSALTVGYPAETIARRGPARLAVTFGTPADAETDKELSMVIEGNMGCRGRPCKDVQGSTEVRFNSETDWSGLSPLRGPSMSSERVLVHAIHRRKCPTPQPMFGTRHRAARRTASAGQFRLPPTSRRARTLAQEFDSTVTVRVPFQLGAYDPYLTARRESA